MAIAFRAASAKAAGTTGATAVGLPAGLQANDIVLLVATTIAGGSITISTAGSITWNAIGNIDVTGGEKLYAWWGRYSSGSTGPSVTPGSDHVCAGTLAYSGCRTDANVLVAAVTGSETTSDTSFNFSPSGGTYSPDNAMQFCIVSTGLDSNTAQGGTMTQSLGNSPVNRMDFCTNSGGGGGFCLNESLFVFSGSVWGDWALTLANATPKAYMAFFLRAPDVTSTQTETGKARIRATSSQTQTGKGRIQTIVSQAEIGKARIQKSVSQTITGKANISGNVTTPQTETGKARIQNTTSQTETGKSRVQIITTQTETGKSRIQIVSSQTQTGKSRIQITVLQTITGKAKIQNTSSQTETGKARITAATPQTITGKGRVQNTSSQAETGKSRIQKSVDQAITGKAAIQNTTSQTLPGKARIQVTSFQTITGVANIQSSGNQAISGKARIQKTISQTITGISRIELVSFSDIFGKARIQTIDNVTITGVARVENIVDKTIFGQSRITGSVDQNISGISRIQNLINEAISGLARIQNSNTQDITGKSNIVLPIFTQDQTITGKANILGTTVRTITGRARIASVASTYPPQPLPVTTVTGLLRTLFAQQGETIYDLCIRAYKTLDLLLKFCTDNDINGIEDEFSIGKIFIFDASLIYSAPLWGQQFSMPPTDITKYIARPGQSIYDICLQTYGTLDLLTKLCIDNGLAGLEDAFPIGKIFTFDASLIFNLATYKKNNSQSIFYATQITLPVFLQGDFNDDFNNDFLN